MNPSFWKIAVFALAVAAVQMAAAAEFEVGRAKVELPGEGWRVVDMADGGKPYSGGVQDKIPSETKVFIKEAADKQVQSIVVIRSSQAGIVNGGLVYSHRCDGTERMYAQGNSGAHTNNYDCLNVWGHYKAGELVDAFAPGVQPKLKESQSVLPPSFQPVRSHFANANGSFAEARVLLAPGFSGMEGAFEGALPKGVEASSVLWAQTLAKAVRSSVSSFSGRLAVPAIEYKNTATVKTVSN